MKITISPIKAYVFTITNNAGDCWEYPTLIDKKNKCHPKSFMSALDDYFDSQDKKSYVPNYFPV